MALQAITIEPATKADACIIWLHGLGANGHDFEGVINELGLETTHAIRFIFPHAPALSVTLNGGYVMPAWYDIFAIDFDAPEDEIGIRCAQIEINALIEKNLDEGIESSRIILMGFSQGGALALHTAIRFGKPLGGVGVLSGYLPLHRIFDKEIHAANQELSIFMAHGLVDDVVPFSMAELSLACLQAAGFNPAWHTYPMPHGICLQELQDIGKWINQQLSHHEKIIRPNEITKPK
ncbi:MAG: carboxylesterase [Proteobacteria bacterium]|nr:carboxylesterase [Pseudomonadota bacterium]